ncbi:MAG TPA: hypothetical protein VGH23_16460 [Rhizomicrobium sp.]|jgi:hypothetical protein
MSDEGAELCPLCGKPGQLVESHVIPAFVFRWLKETSITGYMRLGKNTARRVQDGIKHRWLCLGCERRLSKYETAFATNVFHPYNKDDGAVIRYDSWLLKFCVSVSWRVLTFVRSETGLEKWSSEQKRDADRALEAWRAFLFDEIPHPGRFEQHLLPMGPISNSTVGNLPNNINRYFMRGVEMDVARGETAAMSVAKMGRFALFGIVTPGRDKWKGTRVSPGGGIIQPSQYVLPAGLIDYFRERADRLATLSDSIPEAQKDKIEAAALKNVDRMIATDQFRAMLEDQRIFGTEAILRKPPG